MSSPLEKINKILDKKVNRKKFLQILGLSAATIPLLSPSVAAKFFLRQSNGNLIDIDDLDPDASAPAGNEGEIQFKLGTSLGASNNLYWNNTQNRLGIGTNSPDETLHVVGNTEVDGDFGVTGDAGVIGFVRADDGFQVDGTTVIDSSRNIVNAGTGTFSGTVSAATPVDDDDLSTKGYVDSQIESTPFDKGNLVAGDRVALSGTLTERLVGSGNITITADPTNLGQGTRTTTTVPITSSTGNSATLDAATTSLAGVMSSADKSKLDGIEIGAQVNVGTDLGQGGSGNNRTITSSTGTDVTISTATTTNAGFMSTDDKSKLDSIESGAQVNVGTDLGTEVVSTNSRAITSSTGNNITVPVATTTVAGFMSHTDKSKLDGIEIGAQVNVGTNLGQGGSGNNRIITSSTGSDVTISTATTTNAGFMSTDDKSKLDGIESGAQVNVGTDLDISGSGNSRTITSSTGTNVDIPLVTTTNAGFMSTGDKSKLDGIESGAQVNVGTDLSWTAGTTEGPRVNSSTGNNAIMPSASASESGAVTTGAQTFAGVKTFSSIPVLPSSNPTSDNQAVRKAYVDAQISSSGQGTVTSVGSGDGLIGGPITGSGSLAVDSSVVRTTGDQTLEGVKTFSSIPVLPSSNPTDDNEAVRKAYVDSLISGSNIVSVLDFGAVGDGVTDDIDAINDAIDSLGSDGGVVYFPDTGSAYVISSPIILPSRVHLRGDNKKGGHRSTIKPAPGENISLIQSKNYATPEICLQSSISGLFLDCADTALNGIDLYAQEVTISDCTIKFGYTYGIRIRGIDSDNLGLNNFIHDCYISPSATARFWEGIHQDYFTADLTISRVYIEGCQNACIRTRGSMLICSNNHLYDARYGIYSEDSNQKIITSNYIENIDEEGIWFDNGQDGTLDVIIGSNIFRNIGRDSADGVIKLSGTQLTSVRIEYNNLRRDPAFSTSVDYYLHIPSSSIDELYVDYNGINETLLEEELSNHPTNIILSNQDVINNLTSTDTDKPLSAAQGKELQDNKENAFDKGNISQGAGMSISGDLTNRLIGQGTLSISTLPASDTQPGHVTTGTQTFAGTKTFNTTPLNLSANNQTLNFSSTTGTKTITTGGSTHLNINPGGNVGIGTTDPSEKLEVNGNINVIGTSAYLYAGYNAIRLATKGDASSSHSSTIIGRRAGDNIVDGSTERQTVIGYDAGSDNTGDRQIAIGYQAGRNNEGARQISIGYQAGDGNTGEHQISIGYNAGQNNTGARQTVIGYQAGDGNTGEHQTTLGYQAGRNNETEGQTSVGYRSGLNNTGTRQTSVGYQAGDGNTGEHQTTLGYEAGRNNTTQRQTSVGYRSGLNNTGEHQTSVGYEAGQDNEAPRQTSVGYRSGLNNTGERQTTLGYEAGNQNTGIRSTNIGYRSGLNNTGARLLGLGYEAGEGNSGDDVIAIGYRAGQNNTANNQFIVQQTEINATPLIQGNFSTGNVGIGTTDPSEKLDVNGKIRMRDETENGDADDIVVTKGYVDALPKGKILQIVQGTISSGPSTTSSTYVDTGLEASITPTNSSNKILVLSFINGIVNDGGGGMGLRVIRGATALPQSMYGATSSPRFDGAITHAYLDSPNTTSSTTYKVQMRSANAGTTAIITNSAQTSTLILMEVEE